MQLRIEEKDESPNELVVYCDEKPWREVSKQLFFSELKKFPPILEESDFFSRFHALEEKLAKKQAVFLLSKRNYLSNELKEKLLSKGFSQEACHQAIEYCQQKGFVNDKEHIQRLVSKEQRKGLGTKAIYYKLKQQKKLDSNVLEKALGETTCSEKQTLESWLAKHTRRINLKDPQERKKLIAKLIRRGFSADLVFNTLEARSYDS